MLPGIMIGPGMAAAAAGGTITFSFEDDYKRTQSSGDVTASSMSLGTAAADRIIVVAYQHNDVGPMTSCTIAGFAATNIVENIQDSDKAYASIWAASVTSGTTGDVVLSGVSPVKCASLAVYAMYGASITPETTTTDGSVSGTSVSLNTNISTGELAIVSVSHQGSEKPTSAASVAGITKDHELLGGNDFLPGAEQEGHFVAGSHLATSTETPRTFSVTGLNESASSPVAGCLAVFSPA